MPGHWSGGSATRSRRCAGFEPAANAAPRVALIATTAPDQRSTFQPGEALVSGGIRFHVQVHYNCDGKRPEKDRSSVGFVFAKGLPTGNSHFVFINVQLAIPPGADNHRVDSQINLLRTPILSRCFDTTFAARAGNTV